MSCCFQWISTAYNVHIFTNELRLRLFPNTRITAIITKYAHNMQSNSNSDKTSSICTSRPGGVFYNE